MTRRDDDVRAWLAGQPSLRELRERFPSEWDVVRREIASVTEHEDVDALKAYAARLASGPRAPDPRLPARQRQQALMRAQIRQHMAAAALRQMSISATTGVREGKLRLSLFSGSIAQRLLFARELERKPVSPLAFRLLWPLMRQKSHLMALVQREGIYCFYSSALIDRLARLIDDRAVLEIAAGDGTLSRFLQARGVDITPTDDYSWKHSVRYPETVLRQDARHALQHHRPQVVMCSWPPAANQFEQHVFRTPTVELYIMIGSRHEFATGSWDAYRSQTGFRYAEDPELSSLVLPPEIQPAVYVFRREPKASG